MNTLPHKETALAHVDAVVQTAQHINDLHNEGHLPGRDHRADIARGYDAIRQGLKIAEVHALLAVAEAIEKSAKPTSVITFDGNLAPHEAEALAEAWRGRAEVRM